MSFTYNNNTINNIPLMFVGQIIAHVGTSAPSGWLLCNGSSIATGTEYADLRALIGNTLPDLRGRNLYGNTTASTTGGSSSNITLEYNHLPNHNHNASTSNNSAHQHNYYDDHFYDNHPTSATQVDSNAGSDGGGNTSQSLITSPVTAYNDHTVNELSYFGTATPSAFSVINPYYTVNWIIKY
jgi:microcystin-dependent protein